MSNKEPYTKEEMAVLEKFAASGQKSTIVALKALGLNRSHSSMRVKLLSFRASEYCSRVNVEKRWNAVEQAIEQNPDATGLRIARLAGVTTSVVYAYASKHGGLRAMQDAAKAKNAKDIAIRSDKCRYFVAKKMRECGVPSHGKNYCDEHEQATSPYSRRSIVGVILPYSEAV